MSTQMLLAENFDLIILSRRVQLDEEENSSEFQT